MRKNIIPAVIVLLVFSVALLSGCSNNNVNTDDTNNQISDVSNNIMDNQVSNDGANTISDSQIDNEVSNLVINDTNPYEVGEMI